MTYNEYEQSIINLKLVKGALTAWGGTRLSKFFVKYLFDNDVVVDSVEYTVSTYELGMGGVTYVKGLCTHNGKSKKYLATFRAIGPTAEQLMLEGKEFAFDDTLHTDVILEKVDIYAD